MAAVPDTQKSQSATGSSIIPARNAKPRWKHGPKRMAVTMLALGAGNGSYASVNLKIVRIKSGCSAMDAWHSTL